MRHLAMVAALILAGAPGAGSGDGALLPRVLTVILGLTAAALAARALRRSRSGHSRRR
jgi:hypothetical protein